MATLMKASDCVFYCVHLVNYKCHEINQNGDGSYKFS